MRENGRMWSLARGRLRPGSCIEQRDDLLRRARFAEPREDARDAVRVSLGAAVGHRVDGKRHVIAEFMRLAGGRLDAGAGGDSGDHDLGNAEALEMLLEARACECAQGSLGDRVILRLAVELGDEFRPIGGKRSEIRRLFGSARR